MSLPVLKSASTLAAIAAVCTLLVATTWWLTGPRIEANQQAWLERSLAPALQDIEYDSGPAADMLTLPAPHGLPGSEDARIYRVYRGDAPAAALFVVSARDGYAGPIRLLVGIAADGRLTAIDVLEHRETPGLGDLVEGSKSDWLQQFPGRSLDDPDTERWLIRRDGGDFDQLTGASVTPRAIVKAARQTLQYFDAHRDTVFAASTETEAAR